MERKLNPIESSGNIMAIDSDQLAQETAAKPSLKSRIFQIASAVLPPLLTDAVWKARTRQRYGGAPWEYVGSTWPGSATAAESEGWSHESIAKAQIAKWPAFLQLTTGTGPLGVAHEAVRLNNSNYVEHNTIMVFGYALALAARQRPAASVLDWGSGIGHYARFSRALLPGVEIDYHCYDLPHLCQAGRAVQPDVTFHDDPNTLDTLSFDLVVASGALQCTRDWRATLKFLANATKGYLLITRLPVVVAAPSFVVGQHARHVGYQTKLTSWVLNRGELLQTAEQNGMTLVREFLIQQHALIPHAPERADERGFLFRPLA